MRVPNDRSITPVSDITSIKDSIVDGRFSEEELLDLNHFVVSELKEARARAARRNIHRLKAGGRAKIVGKLRGDAYFGRVGKVVEVKRTRVVMQFEGDLGTVTIPASVLAPADE
jgi:uncharacterized small protein (DUF1192 family)